MNNVINTNNILWQQQTKCSKKWLISHCCHSGLPGKAPQDIHLQKLFYVLITIGQLDNRLIRPYRRLPLRIGQLVNPLLSKKARLDLASKLLSLPQCCVDNWFSKPVLDAMRHCKCSIEFSFKLWTLNVSHHERLANSSLRIAPSHK